MLASLLPGFRELRAPLAAGYLWLITGWILLDRFGLTSDIETSQAVDALEEIRGELGSAGIAVAISFAAFILGAIWEAAVAGVSRSFNTASTSLGVLGAVELSVAREPASRVRWERRQALDALAERLFRSVDEIVLAKLGGSSEPWTQRLLSAIGVDNRDTTSAEEMYFNGIVDPSGGRATQEFTSATVTSASDEWWLSADPTLGEETGADFVMKQVADYLDGRNSAGEILAGVKKPGNSSAHVITRSSIVERVIDELPLTARRLVGEQQQLYLELDRMKAEVDFRFTVAIPLSALLITIGVSLPLVIGIACVILAVGVWVILIWDGVRRDRDRNDVLIDLLRIDRAVSPTFARLKDRAEAIPGEPILRQVAIEDV